MEEESKDKNNLKEDEIKKRGYDKIDIKSRLNDLVKLGITLETLAENSKIQDEYLEKLEKKD
jgi:hypothetical protein